MAWQKAMSLARRVYAATGLFPKHEQYGMVQRLRRAAVSIPSNIAEGYGRGTRRDYAHFLCTARGSLYEIETQLLPAGDFGYLAAAQSKSLIGDLRECSRILGGLIAAIQGSGHTRKGAASIRQGMQSGPPEAKGLEHG